MTEATRPRRLHYLAALLLALGGNACYDFQLAGPEDPPALPATRTVSVVIEYEQIPDCYNAAGRCDDLVVFSGSWMQPGAEFFLERNATTRTWTGVARNVPVNYPPSGDPHGVRIFDPHLQDALTEGYTAERLKVGGQRLLRISGSGGRNEVGLVYVDDNGQGHNPY